MNPRVEWVLKRPKYQKVLMLLVVILLVAGLFVYLLYLPLQEERGRLVVRSNTLESELVKYRNIAANFSVFEAELKKMEEKLNQALTELPNDKEIPKLLTSIASTAKSNGLTVQFFKPGQEEPKGFYAEVPVSLKLVGTYHQIAKFFYDVGSLPRIVNLSNVSLGKAQGGGDRLQVDCLATTFMFLEQNTATK